MKDFAKKLVASSAISGIGLFWSCVATSSVLLTCFRKGFRTVFQWKDRRSGPPPLHYNAWDEDTRHSPGPTTKPWNHAYVTVPDTSLRFHYVYSGRMPNHIAISDVDGETVLLSDHDEDTEGSTKPKLMILCHGYPENWFSWRHVLRYFDDPNDAVGDYFVVAIDMRGYGDSDKPNGYKSYHRNLLASDVKGISLALGFQKFALAGHDWGAIISWDVARIYPRSVEKLIILNCCEERAAWDGLKARPVQFVRSWYVFFYQIPYLPELFFRLADYKSVEAALGSKKGGIIDRENRLTDAEMEVFKYSLRHSPSPPINYYRAFLWPFAQPGPPLTYPMEKVDGDPILQVPVLVIWGDKDAYIVKEMAENEVKYINAENGSKVVFVEGASHWVQQDAPRKTIHHMVDFLKSKL